MTDPQSLSADREPVSSKGDGAQPVARAFRAAAAFAGAAALIAGGFAVFVTDNGTGAAALLAVGLLLVIIAVFFERIESLEMAGAKVVLQKLERTAYELERRTQTLIDIVEAMKPAASAYERVRAEMEPGPERTRNMDDQVRAISEEAKNSSFTAEQVRELFWVGNEGNRITAIAMMQGNARLRDFDVALDVVRNSVSAEELYHSLLLTEEMIADLTPEQQRQLRDALAIPRRRGFIEPGTDRWPIAERIVAKLSAGLGPRRPT